MGGDDAFFDDFCKKEGNDEDKLDKLNSKAGELLTKEAQAINQQQKDFAQALADYGTGFRQIIDEEDVSNKEMLALDDDNPLKGYFFASVDKDVFRSVLEPFLVQAGRKVDEKQVWDAEAAVGEGDEDHTQE